MITTRTLACLSIVSILPFASFAHAEMGPYVGIGAGISKFQDDGFVDDIATEGSYDDSGTAYGFIAGYKFSENFSLEWTYKDYNYSEFNVESLSNTEMQAWHISALVAYPMQDSPLGRMDVFGKFGFGESDFRYKGTLNFGDVDDDDEDETLNVSEVQTSESFVLGVGTQFYINEDFRIRTELDMTTFNLDASFGTGSETYLTKDYMFQAMSATASLVYAF